MAINNSNPQTVAAQPIGTSAIRFSGYSSTGSYKRTTTLPSGSYILYPSGASTNAEYSIYAANNNRTSYASTDKPKFITLTTSETSFSIMQYSRYIARTYNGYASIQGAAYGNELYLIFAGQGSISTSTDTITWVTRTQSAGTGGTYSPFADKDLYCGTYGNGIYIAAGQSGALGTSTDGITWSTRTSATANGINTVIYANNIFVYGAAGGVLSTSTDGITWTTRTSTFGTSAINGIAYGNGVFVAVGASATIRTSTDAITWTSRTSNFGTNTIYGVAYGNGVFVAVASGAQINTSTDGITWTSRTNSYGSVFRSVAYGNGVFVAGGDLPDVLYTSTDGITWTSRGVPLSGATIGSRALVVGDTVLIAASGSTVASAGDEAFFALYDAASSAILN